MQRVTITRALRQVIRITRTDRAGLTQRAAAEAAGLSAVWWKQIEGGQATYATADMLARMCHGIGVSAADLRRIGEGHVADLVEVRAALEAPEDAGAMTAHLMATPGLTDLQRTALVAMAQALRGNT